MPTQIKVGAPGPTPHFIGHTNLFQTVSSKLRTMKHFWQTTCNDKKTTTTTTSVFSGIGSPTVRRGKVQDPARFVPSFSCFSSFFLDLQSFFFFFYFFLNFASMLAVLLPQITVRIAPTRHFL